MTTSTGPFGSIDTWVSEFLRQAESETIAGKRIASRMPVGHEARMPLLKGFDSFIDAKANDLRAHRDAGGALEFAPANPGAFYRAQDCLPDAVAEHLPIDQPHRQDAPRAKN